jgi:Ca2+-binding EF-hand superfamily protein
MRFGVRATTSLMLAALLLVAAEGAQNTPPDGSTSAPKKPPVTGGTIFSPQFLNYCNKDKNGVVTRREFVDCFVDFFNLVDENKDGGVTKAEYDAAVKKAREAQEKRWQETFKQIDKDNDGKLTEAEWKDSRFKEADADRDGAVNSKEFVAATMKGFYLIFLPGGFRACDLNNDGKVTLEEQKKRVEVVFKEFDENGDGVISSVDAVLQGEKQREAKKQSEGKGEKSGQSTGTTKQLPQHP